MTALLIRDLKLAVRSGGGFGFALAFFIAVALIVPLGVGPDTETIREIASGIVWVAAFLSSLLSLDRMFSIDFEDGSLEALAVSPLPLELVVVAKIGAHWLTTGLPIAATAPLAGLLLNLPADGYIWVVASLLVGTPAMSALGAFGASLTAGMKRGGLLLSILVVPLCVPTLIFGAKSIALSIAGLPNLTAFLLLAATTLLSFALVPFAAARALADGLR
ncbi:MAG: heme exporter protein CcmB [Albidovulum sp.]|nr:heme exporter protein CcmB [Albidovulum sp.]MDE0306975.1 heme exporter protein CcmB [Albidovulum sp.]MDE0530847.1 heme exporter protein CcmB [Albidovulum sp.]